MKKLNFLLIFLLFSSYCYAENIEQVDKAFSLSSEKQELNLEDLFSSSSNAKQLPITQQEFLPHEQAFVFYADTRNPDNLILQWQIADGYYLYQHKFKFSIKGEGALGKPQMPPAVTKTDAVYGDTLVYQQPLLEIIIPLEQNEKTEAIIVEYQGCADAGLCYPPITQVVNLSTSQPTEIQEKSTAPIAEQDRIAESLVKDNIFYVLIAFFGFGLLLSLTPCVFPMIPILSSLIVGQGEQVTTQKSLVISVIYVLAMAVTYAIAGVIAGLVGENLQATFQNQWVLISFSLVFIILSLSMFGFYELQIPSTLQTKLSKISHRQESGTFTGVAIMGVLSALIVGPCIAAPLAGALIYIGKTGDALLGGLALFSMSLGMGVLLIMVGVSAGHLLPKAGTWMNVVKSVFGVLLLAVAIWMLDRVLSTQISMMLWASLLIISAIYMNALDTLKISASGWHKLWKGLGIILLTYGILLIIGAASGRGTLLRPLQGIGSAVSATSQKTHLFKQIKGLEGFNRELTAAQGRYVMLDFYADWCVSCVEMEQFTFTDSGVQTLMSKAVLLQADVTANDAQDKELYKHFGIFGPPAILFFTPDGQEKTAYRVVGFMPADEFRQHLTQVFQP